MRRLQAPLAALLLLSSPLAAQERPPIALPGPALQPRAPATDAPNLAADILALGMAMERANCLLNALNSQAVMAAAGLPLDRATTARSALLQSGMAIPHASTNGIALVACLAQRAAPSPTAPVASAPLAPDAPAQPDPTDAPTQVAPAPDGAQATPPDGADTPAEPEEPLTLLQRRRCEDRPNLSFCP